MTTKARQLFYQAATHLNTQFDKKKDYIEFLAQQSIINFEELQNELDHQNTLQDYIIKYRMLQTFVNVRVHHLGESDDILDLPIDCFILPRRCPINILDSDLIHVRKILHYCPQHKKTFCSCLNIHLE